VTVASRLATITVRSMEGDRCSTSTRAVTSIGRRGVARFLEAAMACLGSRHVS
jgi:hypothetical protein